MQGVALAVDPLEPFSPPLPSWGAESFFFFLGGGAFWLLQIHSGRFRNGRISEFRVLKGLKRGLFGLRWRVEAGATKKLLACLSG